MARLECDELGVSLTTIDLQQASMSPQEWRCRSELQQDDRSVSDVYISVRVRYIKVLVLGLVLELVLGLGLFD